MPEQPTIHIVWFTDYSFSELLAAYTDPDQAAHVAAATGAEVHELPVNPDPAEWQVTTITMSRDGNSTSQISLRKDAQLANGFQNFTQNFT